MDTDTITGRKRFVSENSVWILDYDRMQFCRMPKSESGDHPNAYDATASESYSHGWRTFEQATIVHGVLVHVKMEEGGLSCRATLDESAHC